MSPISAYDYDRYAYLWQTIELIICVLFIPWIYKIKKEQWKDSKYQWVYWLWMIIFLVCVVFFSYQWITMIIHYASNPDDL